MTRYYLTTAIDYANGDPHIGHAYEKIGADAIARYRRLRGDDVHFLIGMDEHGHKVAQAAEQRGLTPQQQVDEIAVSFDKMWQRLSISHDRFMRTTEAGHKAGVRALIKRIFDNNPDDFYERSYAGWYCVGCESFKQDAEIVDGKCVLHPTRTMEWVEERNWFFRLSKYAGFLKRLYEERRDFIAPEIRRNEILGLLDTGLEDISASRSRLTWGVPFPAPLSSGETQTTYVWFDALPNYLTATGFPSKESKERWPAQLHIVGKDINRFHTIIWPAMLQAAELPLPERVWVHGFVLLGGERFSKSAGVKLDLNEAIDRFGPDAFRYYLLREIPFDTDGSFSWERFEAVYSSELANTWGNLGSRTIAMVEKYFSGVVPSANETDLDRGDAAELQAYHDAMDGSHGFLLHDGLRRAMASATRGNEYIQTTQPWALAKSPDTRSALETTMGTLVRSIARQCVMLFPFIPGKAQAMWEQLGGPGRIEDQRFESLTQLDAAGWQVRKGEPLFPRPA
ncbi:MAG TPA: methionine--tRNA ligase [Gemmatimonadaceae bacterium]|nr:methionine--tRNA ligase [Gemmatimonadaceae bacterium]